VITYYVLPEKDEIVFKRQVSVGIESSKHCECLTHWGNFIIAYISARF